MRYFDIRQTAPLPSGGHPSSSALPLMFIRPFPARTPRAFHRGRRRPWGRPASRCRTRGFPPVRTRPCGRRSSPPPAPSPTRRSDRLSPPPLSPARRAGPCDTPPFRIALCYPTDAQVPQAALRGRLLGVVSVVGPLEPVAVAGQRLHGQLLLAPRGVGEAGGDFCGISRFREYRISGARGGQGRTRHKQCAESRRTSRPNLASFSRVSTRRDRAQRHLGRNL